MTVRDMTHHVLGIGQIKIGIYNNTTDNKSFHTQSYNATLTAEIKYTIHISSIICSLGWLEWRKEVRDGEGNYFVILYFPWTLGNSISTRCTRCLLYQMMRLIYQIYSSSSSSWWVKQQPTCDTDDGEATSSFLVSHVTKCTITILQIMFFQHEGALNVMYPLGSTQFLIWSCWSVIMFKSIGSVWTRCSRSR